MFYKNLSKMAWLGVSSAGLVALAPTARAQVDEPAPTVEALQVPPPAPPSEQVARLVKDQSTLVALGKALFWDANLGSDGQACASCHFHAGADPLTVNRLSPGLRAVPADVKFGGLLPAEALGKTRSGTTARPNLALQAGDFPFHWLADSNDRNSTVLYDTNDVVSSSGAYDGTLIGIDEVLYTRNGKRDLCSPALGPDTIFKVDVPGYGARRARKVEPRNTPTIINAAYYFRNFWDGRANNEFNGVNPFGNRAVVKDANARIIRNQGGLLQLEALHLPDSSLASQAVGPPLSSFEMSCDKRSFAYLGKKMLALVALKNQTVHRLDSVLAGRRAAGKGLTQTYEQLVKEAFVDDLWNGVGQYKLANGALVPVVTGDFRQIEHNFPLFFGLAIDAYERTLISNDTPFDRFKRGKSSAMSARQIAGMSVFTGKGKCVNCHTGPVFSGAAVPPRQREELIELMTMGDGNLANYDGGFYNIGVRPTAEDLGVGAEDDYGIPLSFTRQFQSGKIFDQLDESRFERHDRAAVDGAFKVPTLRNVALTAPYFHNGGQATLRQVVEFYNRGGDRRGPNGNDTTGFGGSTSNLDPDIEPLGLSETEIDDLVEFLKALTDKRVACHAAPFDHPDLVVFNGHSELTPAKTRLRDNRVRVVATGARGLNAAACDPNTGDLFNRNLFGGLLKPLN